MVLNNKNLLTFVEKKKPLWTIHTKYHKVFDPYLIIQFFLNLKNNFIYLFMIYL